MSEEELDSDEEDPISIPYPIKEEEEDEEEATEDLGGDSDEELDYLGEPEKPVDHLGNDAAIKTEPLEISSEILVEEEDEQLLQQQAFHAAAAQATSNPDCIMLKRSDYNPACLLYTSPSPRD